ncbi:MAG: aldehyde dehydrogenase family protein, partial [Elusimicrobia bacterium]|nr:aldehyde dehydrogenase family protein [Elusimicrobiota bacterium]
MSAAAAARAARRAQPAWAARTPARRKAVLRRFAALVEREKDSLARTLT